MFENFVCTGLEIFMISSSFLIYINTYMKDQHPHELSFCFAVPMTNLLYSFKKTVVAADVVSPEKTSCQQQYGTKARFLKLRTTLHGGQKKYLKKWQISISTPFSFSKRLSTFFPPNFRQLISNQFSSLLTYQYKTWHKWKHFQGLFNRNLPENTVSIPIIASGGQLP